MILKKCPNCEMENPDSAEFCTECGTKLETGEEAPVAPAEPVQTSSTVAPEPAAPTKPSAAPDTQVEVPVELPPRPLPPPDRVLTPAETPRQLPEAPSVALFEMTSPTEPLQTPPSAPAEPSTVAEPAEAASQIPPLTSPPQEKAAESRQAPLATPAEGYPAEEPAPSEPFGERFTVIAELGTGSLGTVYKVFDKAMGREMALRSIKSAIAQNRPAFEGFSRELRVERSIVHKNVGRIFELHLETGAPFITMEYVPGTGLKELNKQKPRIPKESVLSIAKQVCEGLAEAHRLRVIHGDLRPGNIMVDKDGTAKIMDLGIARLLNSKLAAGSQIMLGAPEYQSPEQAEGKVVDERSDIYSLGVILYEMITGSLPFIAGTPEGMRQKHLSAIPRPPHKIDPSVPMKLGLIILRCLEKDKGKRYQTAKELRAELEQTEAALRPGEQPRPSPAPAKPTPAKMEERVISKPVIPMKKIALLKKRGWRKLALPVAAAAACVILALVLWRLVLQPSKGGKSLPLAPQKPSVAVLPFKDLSPAQSYGYLGNAMAETLIETLAAIPELFVPAKSSAFSFKADRGDSIGIGQNLGVDHILEATFQKTEDKLQLTARLLKAKDGSSIWSQQYDRSVEDIFLIEEEIVRNIAKFLKVELSQEKEASLMKNRAVKAEAYDAYAQGRFLQDKGGKDNLEKAIACFERAIEKAPQQPSAYASLVEAYIWLGDTVNWPRDKAFAAAKAAASKALELDPNSARAHIGLAIIKQEYDWDLAGAEKEYREAIRIEPGNSRAHQFYAELLSALSRHDEASAEIKTAQSLDPLSPETNFWVGAALYFSRLYDQAVEELRKASRAAPLFNKNYEYLGLANIQLAQYEDAVESFRRAAELGGDRLDIDLRIAFVDALLGRRREVGLRLTEALKAPQETHVSYVSLGAVYAGLNEKEQALFCLGKAFQERDRNLLFVKVSPLFDSVRADARFTRLLQDIGLVK